MNEIILSLLSFVTLTIVVVSLRWAWFARVLLFFWVIKLVSMLIRFVLVMPTMDISEGAVIPIISIVSGCLMVVWSHFWSQLMCWRR